jgi:hypothetical protein
VGHSVRALPWIKLNNFFLVIRDATTTVSSFKMLATIITFFSMTIAVMWSLVFLPASILGIQLSKVTGFRMKKFLKKVKHSSIWTNDEPEGWICGKGFIGFIQSTSGEQNQSKDLWILCSKTFYQTDVQENEVAEDEKTNKITYWVREGSFWCLNYNSRQLNLPKKDIRLNQEKAITQIMEEYQKRNYAVCLLHGKAGGGKSMTAQYLCAELLKTNKNVHFCDTHSPYEPGDNFDYFYNKISPTEDSPLVLVFEEVDGMIMNLHMGKIEKHKHHPIQIKNKTDWNSFLDKFDREIYPHIIVIMTTNKTANWFDEMDNSYMREGRVNLKIEF